MPKTRARIRMYRPGLGDCFLLTFTSGRKTSHILLDCGIFNGTPGEKARISAIAENIVGETQHKVNAVVATHEHWDHVAGFVRAKHVFGDEKQFTFDEAWVAWTEDPTQKIASENKKQFMAMTEALALACQRLENADTLLERECGRSIAQVMGFEGDLVLGAQFSVLSNEGMKFVSDRAGFYLKPGEVIERDWLPGVRVYVLGPPMDLEAMRNMKGEKDESFESGKNGAEMAWTLALAAQADSNLRRQLRPFDEFLAWSEADRTFADTAPDHASMRDVLKAYDAEGWRRIDNDWLMSAGHLALQVDNAVNNTSLVLAFELVESNKVLLFTGDAQVGNWKSWQNLTFKLSDGTEVQAQDLLARTIFYKVGHHGSGNATLRAGLAAMKNTGLVAAIPTHESWALDVKGWEMPAPKLKPALIEKTKGRIIRADPGFDPIHPPQEGISAAEWQEFAECITAVDDLYIDYQVPT
jgi:hypothetical protein